MLTGACLWDHVTPILQYRQWLTICFWAQFKVLVMTFKALNDLDLGLPPPIPFTPLLKSKSGAFLCIPHMTRQRSWLQEIQPFSGAAPILSSPVQMTSSLVIFNQLVNTVHFYSGRFIHLFLLNFYVVFRTKISRRVYNEENTSNENGKSLIINNQQWLQPAMDNWSQYLLLHFKHLRPLEKSLSSKHI